LRAVVCLCYLSIGSNRTQAADEDNGPGDRIAEAIDESPALVRPRLAVPF
jgi:hypothetical protein